MVQKELQKIKSQHYVWQHYLRKWSPDHGINIYHITSKGKIVLHGIKGVAREDAFYKIGIIKRIDFDIVDLITKNCEWDLKIIHRHAFSTVYSIQRETLAHREIAEKIDLDILDIINNNVYENYMSKLELSGRECLDRLTLGDVSVLTDTAKYEKLSRFICHQFSRTLKMKSIILSALEKSTGTTDAKNIIRDFHERNWWFMVSFHATNLSKDMLQNLNKKAILLENKTTEKFITSDQPVINIHPDGHLSENIDYYYPISPTVALLIKTSDFNYFDYKNMTAEDVIFLNSEIAKQSFSTIFSIEKKDIENVMPHYKDRCVI